MVETALGLTSESWVAISAALSCLILFGTALAALGALRDARRTRHATLMADLARRLYEPSASESRILFSEYASEDLAQLVERIYGAEPPSRNDVETFWQLAAFPMLLEQIGVLHAEKAISTRVVYRMWGASIAAAWESWRETVGRIRQLESRSGVYEAFEDLARAMRNEIERREGLTSSASDREAT